jgi:hypothetical protein
MLYAQLLAQLLLREVPKDFDFNIENPNGVTKEIAYGVNNYDIVTQNIISKCEILFSDKQLKPSYTSTIQLIKIDGYCAIVEKHDSRMGIPNIKIHYVPNKGDKIASWKRIREILNPK